MQSVIFKGLALLALTFGLACSNLRLSSDWDVDVDFSKIQTYAWIGQTSGVQGIEPPNSLLDKRIRKAVHDTLIRKGFREVDRAEADVVVSYHLGIEKKLDVRTLERGYGYAYRGAGRYRGYGGYSDTYVTQYDEGTLLLDLVEPKKMQIVWRGSAQSRISEGTSPGERQQRVREVIDKILEQYPPNASDDGNAAGDE
jgi:hypothetical protein